MRRLLVLLAATGLATVTLASPASADPLDGCLTAPAIGPFQAAQVCIL